jgi:hypothetical protein
MAVELACDQTKRFRMNISEKSKPGKSKAVWLRGQPRHM